MQAEVILPDLGAAPVVLSVWYAEPGEWVYEGDRLVEVLVLGATFDLSAPATGRLVDRRAVVNERLQPGQVLGIVEEESH
jgi:pyruvate/2-oxoglutarate dehydrogenase complex dihydrolipoamide acyltransferase (E2) component